MFYQDEEIEIFVSRSDDEEIEPSSHEIEEC
jgi:hypothetical protein